MSSAKKFDVFDGILAFVVMVLFLAKFVGILFDYNAEEEDQNWPE